MKYDDASWHYNAEDFPRSSPLEWGGTHIALLLKWCLQKGWAGEIIADDADALDAIEAVVAGSMSATEFFFDHCDGKFFEEELTEEGNRFVKAYYDTYLQFDYIKLYGAEMFEIGEEDHDYDELARVIESRYMEFLADPDTTFGSDEEKEFLTDEDKKLLSDLTPSSSHQEKPWWKFW